MPLQTERIPFANAPATAADTKSDGIPRLGYGCWNLPNEQAADLVYGALEAGKFTNCAINYDVCYRHIDSAAIYGNEKEVGEGINRWLKATGTPRSEIFVTSKLWLNSKRAENVARGLTKTLDDLKLEYLDLYLIHWPGSLEAGQNFDGTATIPQDDKGFPIRDYGADEEDTWAALEAQIPQKVKNIGISNYTKSEIEDLLKYAKIKPSSLQVECHVYLQQKDLVAFAQSKGIQVTAYSPFGGLNPTYGGTTEVVSDPLVQSLATKHNTTPHGIVLSFLISRNIVPIPKSVTKYKENFDSIVKLDADDVKALEGADKGKRYNDCSEMLGYIFFKDEKSSEQILTQIAKAGLTRAQAKVEHLVGK
ncbi:Aldo/keto reductase [Wallemia mellicola]|nr:Aldo/keto reductase [Wallemia mellicola]TIB96071.1 Aldo/keto reductase [Wallemia mellicola]TIC21696.1 Aldo/keto reductase [Wallemia mellicola]TIC28309.1 Aldo/keto reductase [Wallemia mellicola]